MGRLTRLTVAWSFVCAASAAAPALAGAQSADAIRDTVLDNGLQVIVMPNHATPVATLEVAVRGGAMTQVEPADVGLPHVLEHILFKTYKGGEGFGMDAQDAGAIYNGTTSEERVTYYVTLPSENAQKGVELLANLVRDPDFDAKALEDERQVVRGELERMVSDPYSILYATADRALWGSAFQRKDAIGNMGTILSATPDRLRTLYHKFYVPNNAALIASGDVSAPDVFAWAQDRFRRWKAEDDPFADFQAPEIRPLAGDSVFVLDMTSTDVTLQIEWQGPSASSDREGTLAADVFSEIVNMPTSGAQKRLVDTGLFQSVSLRYQTLDHVGPIRLVARTTPDNLVRALGELGVELYLFSDPSYVDDEILAAAKRSLRVEAAIDRERGPSAAHTMATYWAVAGLDYYESYEAGLQGVTIDDIHAYLQRYVVGHPRVIAALATTELVQPLSRVLGQIVQQWPKAQ